MRRLDELHLGACPSSHDVVARDQAERRMSCQSLSCPTREVVFRVEIASLLMEPTKCTGSWYPESLIRETGFHSFLVNLGFGPRERLGVNIVGFDEGVDVGHQFLTRVERGAGQRLGRQDRKPYFDLIEPGRLGRRKVKVGPTPVEWTVMT